MSAGRALIRRGPLSRFQGGFVLGPTCASALRAAALVIIVSGCETIPPPPQVVKVPVPVSCIKTLPERPDVHTDEALATFDDYKFTLAIFSDRRMLLDYTAELEAVLSACK